MKDSIINFGDNLEESIIKVAEKQAQEADLILSLGTTMQIVPACNLVTMGKEPLRLVIVNRQKTAFDDLCCREEDGKALGVRIFGDCDQVMQQIMEQILTTDEKTKWEGERETRTNRYDTLRT